MISNIIPRTGKLIRSFTPLVIVNATTLALLVTFYVLAFDLQWGFNRQAITWGLPLLFALACILVAVIFIIKRKGLGWCVTSLVATIIGTVHLFVMINFFDSSLIAPSKTIPEEYPATVENEILAQFLTLKPDDGFSHEGDNYRVALSEAYIGGFTEWEDEFITDAINPELNPDLKASIKATFKEEGYDFDDLVDRLFERNLIPTKLNLESSLQDGYYIDYDDKYIRYSEGSVFLFERWSFFHPHADTFRRVSIPAYNPETGFVLIYSAQYSISTQSAFYGFRFENGELIEVSIADFMTGIVDVWRVPRPTRVLALALFICIITNGLLIVWLWRRLRRLGSV